MDWTSKMEGGGMLYLRDEGNYMYLEATRPQDTQGLYKVILQGLHGQQVLGTMTPCETGLKLSRMVSRSTMGQWGCLPLTKVICQLSFPFDKTSTGEHRGETEGQALDYPQGALLSPGNSATENKTENVERQNPLPPEPSLSNILPDILPDPVPNLVEETDQDIQWEAVPLYDTTPPETKLFSPCPHPDRLMKDPLLESCFRRCKGVEMREGEEGLTLAVPYDCQREFVLSPIFCFGQLYQYQGERYVLFSFTESGKPCENPNFPLQKG